MADISVVTSVAITRRGMRGLVFSTSTIGYLFYTDANSDFVYQKTTDGGLTWGTAVAISGAETIVAYDVWYDQWTPGDTGRLIHIWYFGTAADDILYRSLNTSNDSLLAAVTVFNGGSAVAGRGTFVSGTKTRGGNLVTVYNIDAFAETGANKSVDNGATWSSITNPLEANLDQCMLFPGNVADKNDMWALYDDDSAAELTLKEYDDSANTWAESAALTFNNNATDLTGQYGFSGSIRHSDGHLIAAFMDAYDAAGASDFKVYDINSTGSLTALTDIATNVQDIYYPSVYLNQDQPDYIYVANLGVSAGTSTLGSSVPCVYALSKNRGITWTKDLTYSASTTDYICTWAPLNGERFMVFWQDLSSLGLVTNQDNSIGFGFTQFNNYESVRATGSNNTGIISVTEKIR